MKVEIRSLAASDEGKFVAAVGRSARLHKPWVSPPRDREAFARYLARFEPPNNHGFVVCTDPGGHFAGAVNITNIVYGAFRSGYLGFFAFEGFQGQGFMKQGLRLVARYAFNELGLHRLEANIQPANAGSIALVKSCGFRHEGFSPRYLKVAGRWRDHERWALLNE
jgi:ribosomal-protein-alanine N-acetyltransferase